MPAVSPQQGDIFWVDLDPVRGHEQGKKRPCIIVSPNWVNHGASGLVFAVPLTTKFKNISTHVRIDPLIGNLSKTSYAMPEQLRVISINRLDNRIGSVPDDVLEEVQYHLCMLLDLG